MTKNNGSLSKYFVLATQQALIPSCISRGLITRIIQHKYMLQNIQQTSGGTVYRRAISAREWIGIVERVVG